MRAYNINRTITMNYKVLKPFFKLSNRANYAIDDVIELSKEDAQAMLNEGYLEETKSKEVTQKEEVIIKTEIKGAAFSTKVKSTDDDGTKGISTRKTIEEADAEIKEANKTIQDTDND